MTVSTVVAIIVQLTVNGRNAFVAVENKTVVARIHITCMNCFVRLRGVTVLFFPHPKTVGKFCCV